MIKISFPEYINLDKSSKSFVFKMEGCFLCNRLISILEEDNRSSGVYIVDGKEEDEKYLVDLGITGVPYSVSFNENSEIIYSTYGVLNEKQTQEFLAGSLIGKASSC